MGRFESLPRLLTRDVGLVEQHIREGRFQRSLALIAGASSIFAGLEAGTEHYRGSYSQRIMYTPIALSGLLTVTGIWSAFSRRVARTVLPVVSTAALLDGTIGFFFHLRGIHRKPGGWRIPVFNVIMGPPIFAPLLFGISGFLGLIASFLRTEDAQPAAARRAPVAPRPRWLSALPAPLSREAFTAARDLREGRFQRFMAAAAAVSALLNGFEALYSHYKNNFTYKSQWTPILLTPAIAVAGFGSIWSRRMAHTVLPIVSLLAIADGMAGFLYHARGIVRMPEGPRKPLYLLTYGPPIFAPLLFAATGFLGLLASLLRRSHT
ncbi:MAG: hypothetical protein IVW57_07825 [Ktedonobacterales bacterium]|nr:hypothetical protein [Ktedonobacterales bacterium]